MQKRLDGACTHLAARSHAESPRTHRKLRGGTPSSSLPGTSPFGVSTQFERRGDSRRFAGADQQCVRLQCGLRRTNRRAVRGLWAGVLQGGCRRGKAAAGAGVCEGCPAASTPSTYSAATSCSFNAGYPLENGAENGRAAHVRRGRSRMRWTTRRNLEPAARSPTAAARAGRTRRSWLRPRCTRTCVCACRSMPA
jgi:hypothetical protein